MPYLTPRNYLSPSMPYVRAQRHSASLGQMIKNWRQTIVQSWKRRQMVASLHAMDDRLLADIGLTRGQIETFSAGLDARELDMRPVQSGPTHPALVKTRPTPPVSHHMPFLHAA